MGDEPRLRTVLYLTQEAVRIAGVLLQPAMPHAAARLLCHLGVPEEERSAAHAAFGREPGAALPDGKCILFQKC